MIRAFTFLFAFLCHLLIPLSLSADGLNEYSPDNDADFEVGKDVFYEKVFCPTCPYPMIAIPAGIPEIMPELKREGSLGKELTLKERRSLAVFLDRQFDIEMDLQ